MTAWARLARGNSEQSCGNDGAMESQHRAFHSSLEISQKTRDFHIPTAPATGCFTGTKKESKRKKTEGRLHKSLYTALMTLSLDEFLRRFLLHLLPEGFVRFRNFGFLANRKRATTLPPCFQLLSAAPLTEQEASTAGPSDLCSCPKCGGPMMVVERLTAAEIQLRSQAMVRAAV